MVNPTLTLIQAVPWVEQRARRAEQLAEEAGGAEIVWDEVRSQWFTFMKVLQVAADRPFILLEDDVYLAPDWRARVEKEIAEHPDDTIRFSCVTISRKRSPCGKTSRYITADDFKGMQNMYFPAGRGNDLLRAMFEFADKRPHHDGVVGEWHRRNGVKMWVVRPDLVQHEEWDSLCVPGRQGFIRSMDFEETP